MSWLSDDTSRLATTRILDAAAAILGPELLVWATELFAKHPNDPGVAIGWHRDQIFAGVPCYARTPSCSRGSLRTRAV